MNIGLYKDLVLREVWVVGSQLDRTFYVNAASVHIRACLIQAEFLLHFTIHF